MAPSHHHKSTRQWNWSVTGPHHECHCLGDVRGCGVGCVVGSCPESSRAGVGQPHFPTAPLMRLAGRKEAGPLGAGDGGRNSPLPAQHSCPSPSSDPERGLMSPSTAPKHASKGSWPRAALGAPQHPLEQCSLTGQHPHCQPTGATTSTPTCPPMDPNDRLQHPRTHWPSLHVPACFTSSLSQQPPAIL